MSLREFVSKPSGTLSRRGDSTGCLGLHLISSRSGADVPPVGSHVVRSFESPLCFVTLANPCTPRPTLEARVLFSDHVDRGVTHARLVVFGVSWGNPHGSSWAVR